MIIDFAPKAPESYVKNCLIINRPDEKHATFGAGAMFSSYEGVTCCALDGYAIIPMEEYTRLQIKAGESCPF